jgi:hypothetical protein
MSAVRIISHPETGAMFTPTKNEEWVKCQLRSEQLVAKNGIVTVEARVAFPLISAKVVPLLSSLKSGDVFPMPGKIITKTTSVPQYEGHKEVVNPTTGEQMGYYRTYAFTTNLQEQDIDEKVPSVSLTTTKAAQVAASDFAG